MQPAHPQVFDVSWNPSTGRWEAHGLLCFWGSEEVAWRAFRANENVTWEIEVLAHPDRDPDLVDPETVVRQVREELARV